MTRPLAVIIVEDSNSDVQLIIRLLTRAGFALELEQVENAEQMRRALERRDWDIVISDYSLPQFNGLAALALLQETGRDIPFIAVSGTMGEETAVAMMRAGARDYVMKDNLPRLAPAVERELEQAQLRRERREAENQIQIKDDLLRRTGQMAQVGGWELDVDSMRTTVTDEINHIFGMPPEKRIDFRASLEFYVGESYDRARQAARAALDFGQPYDLELEIVNARGERKWIRASGQPQFENGRVTHIRGIVHDITERKQRELELQRYREDLELINKLNEIANKDDGIHQLAETLTQETQRLLDARDCAIYLLSPDGKYLILEYFTLPEALMRGLERLLGGSIPKVRIPFEKGVYFQKILHTEGGAIISDPEVMQQWIHEFTFAVDLPPLLSSIVQRVVAPVFKLMRIGSIITVPLVSDGRTIGLLDLTSEGMFRADDLQRIFKISGQITAVILRKLADQALRESEQKYQMLTEVSPVGVFQADAGGQITYVNPRLREISGVPDDLAQGDGWLMGVAEEDRPRVQEGWQTAIKNQAVAFGEYRYRRPDGSIAWVLSQATPQKDGDGRLAGYVGTITDITESKRAQERIVTQLRRLSALNEIDATITTSLDLNLVLNVLVEQATEQLGMDAACVLLLHTERQTLEFATGRGFRKRSIESTCLRMGDSFAGRAAAQRRIVQASGLELLDKGFSEAIDQSVEAFVFYCGAPLVVKGEVKGVLEVFHRSEFEGNPEWLEYMDTLAEQAAIAIDNGQLFENLERSNRELSQAYDATIEGWSRALDLRDRETEGHTLRVTDVTVRLAKVAGAGEAELVHVRRGALLHDIGKLGVPDAILLKPAALTAEETAIMRRHPLFAYEMLSPIAYLRPALDIPQYHHEMWNGEGYPYGLGGEQIPLMARLFAVVDVWDALLSDRPYRQGWPQQKVLDYLRARSGSHFDPRAVKLFFDTIMKK